MLNFIYYPVSFILWVWHKVFGYVLGDSNGFAWALSVVFLVFTLRAILYKPFVGQVRSMRKMQEMQPEMQKLRKKYANDKQKLATEMQKLQQQNGANPLAGCLPILVQVPVFIGLFHVLREFSPLNNNGTPRTENYFFDKQGVQSFIDSDLFGAKLGAAIHPLSNFGGANVSTVEMLGGNYLSQWLVMVPLMIAAGVFTHITARHSVARQQAQAQAMDNTQQAIMQKLMLYVFPIGVVVGAPFLPLAILFYWVSNNLWTLGQQYLVYKRIDAEETEKREKATEAARSLAPRPGQKPVRPKSKPEDEAPVSADTAPASEDVPGNGTASSEETPANGKANGSAARSGSPSSNGGSANGSSSNGGASNGGASNGAASNGGSAKKKPGAKPVTAAGSSGKRPQGGSGNRSKPGNRPSGNKRKRPR